METFWPLIGGREVLIEKMAPALRARGHQVMIITGSHRPGLPEREVRNGTPIHRFPLRQALASKDISSIAPILEQLARLNSQFRPDVVHLHDLGSTRFFWVRSSRAKPVRLALTVHGHMEAPTEGIYAGMAESIRLIDRVTAVSASALARLLELVPEVKDRASVIHNGCELPPIEPLPLPFDPPRILCLSRMSVEKRLDLVLSAFAKLRTRFPSVQLTMVGDGDMRDDLQQQAHNLALDGAVHFPGMVPTESIWDLLNQATMVVLSSRTEGLPLVVLEASLMERPVVASRVGGLPEAVVHRKTGLLFSPLDPQPLTQAMSELLSAPDETQAMGKAARRHVLNNFSWQGFVDQYEALYREMIAEIN